VDAVLVRVRDVSVDLVFLNQRLLAETFARIWAAGGLVESHVSVAAGDVAAIEDLMRTYGPLRELVGEQADAARARGDATFTVEVDLPERARDDIAYVVRLLGRIEELGAEETAALPAPPEVREWRVQILAAIAEQLQQG
jgi:hypothetical protein